MPIVTNQSSKQRWKLFDPSDVKFGSGHIVFENASIPYTDVTQVGPLFAGGHMATKVRNVALALVLLTGAAAATFHFGSQLAYIAGGFIVLLCVIFIGSIIAERSWLSFSFVHRKGAVEISCPLTARKEFDLRDMRSRIVNIIDMLHIYSVKGTTIFQKVELENEGEQGAAGNGS